MVTNLNQRKDDTFVEWLAFPDGTVNAPPHPEQRLILVDRLRPSSLAPECHDENQKRLAQ
jgi:hypothetical protein